LFLCFSVFHSSDRPAFVNQREMLNDLALLDIYDKECLRTVLLFEQKQDRYHVVSNSVHSPIFEIRHILIPQGTIPKTQPIFSSLKHITRYGVTFLLTQYILLIVPLFELPFLLRS